MEFIDSHPEQNATSRVRVDATDEWIAIARDNAVGLKRPIDLSQPLLGWGGRVRKPSARWSIFYRKAGTRFPVKIDAYYAL